MPNDSPAGVALKYGVSLPDIRRWNQLWPSDSIHLRKVLYIPFDKARHAKQFRIIFVDADQSVVESESAQSQSGSTVIPADEDLPHEDTRAHLTVVRVPVTQLSFFPPPLTPPSARRSASLADHQTFSYGAHSSSERPALPTSFLSSSSSLPTSSSLGPPYTSLGFSFGDRAQNRSLGLGSLWTSARATFVERLSLDSNSATSTQSEDMDCAHELEDIKSPPHGAQRPDEESISGLPGSQIPSRRRRTSGRSSTRPTALELDHDATARFEGMVQKPEDRATPARVAASLYEATCYDDPEPDLTSPVRTAQLQPSLAMQLPPIRKKAKPSAG